MKDKRHVSEDEESSEEEESSEYSSSGEEDSSEYETSSGEEESSEEESSEEEESEEESDEDVPETKSAEIAKTSAPPPPKEGQNAQEAWEEWRKTCYADYMSAKNSGASRLALIEVLPSKHPPPDPKEQVSEKYPLHWYAYYDKCEELKKAYEDTPEEERILFDDCGNTCFHVAVLRENMRAVECLMALSYPFATAKNRAGLLPLHTAVQLKNKNLVRMMSIRSVEFGYATTEAFKGLQLEQAKKVVKALPDHTFQFSWGFKSTLLWPLVKALAPSDKVKITKQGTSFRTDFTLVPASKDEKESMFKFWKRSPITMLAKLPEKADDSGEMWMIDHAKTTKVDINPNNVSEEDKKAAIEDIDNQALKLVNQSELLDQSSDIKDLKYWQEKTLFGKPKEDMVEGYKCQVWQMQFDMVSMKLLLARKPECKLEGDFTAYLASGANSKEKIKKKQMLRVCIRYWLAENYPVKIDSFSDALQEDLNSDFLKKFVTDDGDSAESVNQEFFKSMRESGLFPIKFQWFMIPSVSIVASMKGMTLIDSEDPIPEEQFKVPADYKTKSLRETQLEFTRAAEDQLDGGIDLKKRARANLDETKKNGTIAWTASVVKELIKDIRGGKQKKAAAEIDETDLTKQLEKKQGKWKRDWGGRKKKKADGEKKEKKEKKKKEKKKMKFFSAK
mmetsp:Transcript_28441/g.34543  ORF Transcript_28441/g.34543 Transcript_28441/m.34543 type:complete len:675 (-) Transcript_28441:361-2385(-)